ncbi:MAG: CBS domain-containing protein, partial [Candidatus Hodarchaeales archaeon]
YVVITIIIAENNSLETKISEIIISIVSFSLKTRILEAFDIMKKEQVEMVPVTDNNNKLFSVVTVMDVFSTLEAFSE